MTDREFLFWDILAHVKHFVGIHTWVPQERWLLKEGLIEIRGFVCWICPKTRGL